MRACLFADEGAARALVEPVPAGEVVVVEAENDAHVDGPEGLGAAVAVEHGADDVGAVEVLDKELLSVGAEDGDGCACDAEVACVVLEELEDDAGPVGVGMAPLPCLWVTS